MSKPLLQLSNISKRFPPSVQSGKRFRAFWQLLWQGRAEGGTRVLHDISFQINPGESLGIIGANGAGKSTLLKIISSVLSPSSGTIVKNGSIRSEEHTSELQSRGHLVCRLLLEKKKQN